ncbi:DUF2797 domain-containing protein [Streptomyces sp. VRA16 Mangrove soil]|uniref:DUF2797 domain-containing protein n=1 Tax=Streptomyces sp. VRA16 Mangrove soil TaxID=2817434 RepID=UPI001E316698|nr:DUF2797 domain-containing protein [Streptomyces sp. VRA16 Mangrove soil]
MGWTGDGGGGERESAVRFGEELAFRVAGARRCLGVWRGGRRTACPGWGTVPVRGTRAQCAECAGIDRAQSVAADTMADDPRPYHVYLAWFGDGLVKVGITGVARDSARLLEQGALSFTWLGQGPLMAARRAEELLRVALGVPDRIPYESKRLVRGAGTRGAEDELGAAHRIAVGLEGWPESLARLPCQVVGHGEVFGLGAVDRVDAVVSGLGEGDVVAGRVVAAAGPDLHLVEPDGRRLVVDTRLLAGWPLERGPGDGAGRGPEVRDVPGVQGGLF